MISIIAAIADNGVIGNNNTLPWHLPADLKYFKKTTLGHPVIMGRKNHEDIGRPLPDRLNIVISRDASYSTPGCTVVTSATDAIAAARGDSEVFVIGGAQIYKLFLPLTSKLYITEIHAEVQGTVRFPDWDRTQWQEITRETHPADESNCHAYSFVTYERRP